MTYAVIYARFSPRRESETCQSIETQEAYCRAWCDKRAYEVKGLFADRGRSGADIEREGLWAAVDALKRGDVLVCHKFDRLARGAFVAISVERAVLKAGARMESASGEGTVEAAMTPDERLKIGILRLFAEFERECIRARTRAAMRHHQSVGRRMSKRVPFGWLDDPNDPARMVKHEGEQALLLEMLRMNAAGENPAEIARTMDRQGLAFRGSPKWHARTVARIIERAKRGG